MRERSEMVCDALVSLKQTLERRLSHSESRIFLPNSEVESILETVTSVQNSEKVNDLQRQIKDLTYKLEDLIESLTSDRFLPESESFGDEGLTLAFAKELLKDKQLLISITKTLKTEEDQRTSYSFPADGVSSRAGPGEENNIVGLEEELRQLQIWLFQDSKKLDVVSIVGMTGIGKTTLAKEVYKDQLISRSFGHRLFVRVGPRYKLKNFLLFVVNKMHIPVVDIHKKKDREIGVDLYQFLVGRKYLIVLDDVWNTQIWNELKHCFPDDKEKGSRIILTTSRKDVARVACTSGHFLEVPFLNEERSWILLHHMVFNTGMCPHELERFGKKIAKNCDGLPQAIVSMAKLCKSDKTVEHWRGVSENKISYTSGDDDAISEALSLSYKQLPPHLKACFLYMGVFPQNYEIPASKLLKLWVAEGFIEPQRDKTLEEIARECLDDLVSRNLVLACERSSRGRTKTCRVHFLIRNLCVTEAGKGRFFHVVNKYADSSLDDTNSQQRLSIHNNVLLAFEGVHSMMQSNSGARSLLCVGPQHQHPLPVYISLTLLRVLDALTIHFYKFPHQVLELVELKYLAITYDGELPASISGLQNLEVLIVHRYLRIKFSDSPVYLPIEIWKLQRLKHLECMGFDLPDPSTAAKGTNGDGPDAALILEKLLTLSGVSVSSCNHGVFAGMPNLLKLRIWIGSTHDAVETFSVFGDSTDICHNLESFKCIVMNRGLASQVVSPIPAFPKNLKKITLSRCGFSWKYMTNIEEFPKLEVLKLRCCAFRGPKWETCEGQFSQLKFLLLEDLDIEYWITDQEHFPLLKHVIIRHCYKLQEIPGDIIDFPALEMIVVNDCSPSAMRSAGDLLTEQKESGNENPRFRIHSSWKDDMNLT